MKMIPRLNDLSINRSPSFARLISKTYRASQGDAPGSCVSSSYARLGTWDAAPFSRHPTPSRWRPKKLKQSMLSLIFLILILLLLSSCSNSNSDDSKAKKLIDYQKNKYDNLPLSGEVIDGVRVINVKAFQYGWDPENIVVKKGEKIRFIVETIDVPHGFELEGIMIPGWDPDTVIKEGDKPVIELVAEDAGEWDIICTVYCGPGHGNMKGKYIVKGIK